MIADQCEFEDNYSIQCNNAVDVRRVVIVDIGNIGDDSNFNNELDACHDYDDDVRLCRNIDSKHLAKFTTVQSYSIRVQLRFVHLHIVQSLQP